MWIDHAQRPGRSLCRLDSRAGGGLSRREMLRRSGMGFGLAALANLVAEDANAAEASPLSPKAPHFAPRAKRVVHLFMNGGPSHIDSFDPKPLLARYAGKMLPTPNLPTERKTGTAFPSPFRFQKRGESGIEVSELFPHIAQSADDLCVVRSMRGDVPNHEPSLLLMNCGEARMSRPCLGSWVTYGLGTENQNLPGFVVLCPGGYPIAETANWQASFLPGIYQGMHVDPRHEKIEALIEHIQNRSLSRSGQRAQLDLLAALNQIHRDARENDPRLEARIQSFELAYRMQMEATDAFDIDREPAYIRAMYGPGVQGRQMLIVRRLLERGVRFIQAWHGEGQPWDSHDDLETEHKKLALECDQAIGALLRDLKQRGMLEDTLVVWGGEFGRTPTVELPTPGANAGKMNGRDHNHYGFTMWLAGGGVRGGHVHGSTDDFGFRAIDKPVHIHDLHATILWLLGFDHQKLTYRYAGRDFRLTDVHGQVIREIFA